MSGTMTDSKMPERIWAVGASGGGCVVSFDTPSLDYKHEYIRADLAHPAPVADAEVEAAINALLPFAEACEQVDSKRHPDTAGFIGAGLTLGDLRGALAAITALRARTAQPVGVMVKPLVWEASADGRGLIAVTEVGQYAVFDEGDPRWAYSKRGGYTYHHVDSFQAAKAAAQADYEQRILSALLPKGGA